MISNNNYNSWPSVSIQNHNMFRQSLVQIVSYLASYVYVSISFVLYKRVDVIINLWFIEEYAMNRVFF